MTRYFLIATAFILLPLKSFSTEEVPCQKGNCSNEINGTSLSYSSMPSYNNNASQVLSGSNVMIQNNVQASSRIMDTSCQNDTISINGYTNRAKSNTNPSLYSNHSDSWGVQLNVNIVAPWDQANENCLSFQEKLLIEKDHKLEQENIRLCVDMLQHNFQISDQLKKSSPQLALCDHIRRMRNNTPEQYEELISSLQKENIQLRKEMPVDRVVIGYKEYRLRFLDYKNNCRGDCNGEYASLKEYLTNIQDNFGKAGYILYAEPYQDSERVSVFIRNNFLTKKEADKHRQRFVVAGYSVKVQGVRGTEIYKNK